MNRNFKFKFRTQSLNGKLSGLAFIIVLCLSVSAFDCNPFSSAGTDAPQVTIQNARASRDQMGLPVVTMNYAVKYPSDLYASTIPGEPTLTCTMEQGQLTRTRTFTGAPAYIAGKTVGPQTGQVSIHVPEDGKFIAGGFNVRCTLASDRLLATSNTISVDISKLPDSVVENTPDASGETGNWVNFGVGDCGGRDIGSSDGLVTPVAGKCNASSVSTVAVCWDGVNYKNGGTRRWCTYKNVSASACTGGGAPGQIYECRPR